MAQFRAIIRGQRGEASRLGSKKSGIQATINGWHCGVRVSATHDEKTGEDRFIVSVTGGSNGASPSSLVFTATDKGVSIAQAHRSH
jgi:hypothetical protein